MTSGSETRTFATMTTAAERYLDLLKRVLTNTLFAEEPDVNASQAAFVTRFLGHYVNGPAI